MIKTELGYLNKHNEFTLNSETYVVLEFDITKKENDILCQNVTTKEYKFFDRHTEVDVKASNLYKDGDELYFTPMRNWEIIQEIDKEFAIEFIPKGIKLKKRKEIMVKVDELQKGDCFFINGTKHKILYIEKRKETYANILIRNLETRKTMYVCSMLDVECKIERAV